MFDRQFQLRYFEMNRFGEASPVTMLTLLEEAASDHCTFINHGLYDLYAQNVAWLLISGYMEMKRYPSYKEKITVRTWLSDLKTARGYRENLIYDEQEKIIGRAKGLWVFYDIKKRRPAKIFDAIHERWPKHPVECNYDIEEKITPVEAVKHCKKFNVYNYDMDANDHVNNLRYLQWALETVPEDISQNYFLHSIEGRFLREAYTGHEIESCTEQGNTETCFKHTINDLTGGYACVTGKSMWCRRK
jgi:acyl-ACP thioesterase